MTSGMRTVIYPVHDLDKAKELYTTLFGNPVMDAPYYVGWSVAGQDVGLDPHGHAKGMTGPTGYWHVPDIESSLKLLLEAGAEVRAPVTDVGGGKLIATLVDADGNPVGLIQEA